MKKTEENQEEVLVNPLKAEIITVRFVPRDNGITDRKHVLFGGMAENSKRTYTLPRQRSGELVNPLTKEEKAYFEDILGTDMSIYKGFWNNFFVEVPKEGIRLDLSKTNDYLKYKVLLANKNLIAASKEELKNNPKATYQFVLSSDKTDTKIGMDRLNVKKECYKLLGKYEDDFDTMRIISELYFGRAVTANTKIETLLAQIDDQISENPKKVYDIMSDSLLSTIVMMRKLTDEGVLYRRGDFYYVRADNMPLCEAGQDPTMRNAARFLNSPKHQELLLSLQAKLTITK